MAFLLEDKFKFSDLLDKLVELFIDTLGTFLDEVFYGALRVLLLLEKSDNDLLVRLLLFEHLKADLEALSLGVVQQVLAQVHETATSPYKDASSLDLN